MRFLMRFQFPTEIGNKKMSDPQFGQKMQELMKEINAEAVYLTSICGERGGYVALSFDDPSRIAAIAEQFFFWLNAEVEFMPVMAMEDLARAAPDIKAAQAKWKV